MKKKINGFILFVMVVAIICSSLGTPIVAFATETIAEGSCGEGIEWELDSSGNLTISGKGYMTNYDISTPPPWSNNNVITVTIMPGVKSVGAYAFYFNNNKLESIEFPEGLVRIGHCAFSDCYKLTSIEFKEGLQYIEHRAFNNCGALENVYLPNGLLEIKSGAFGMCRSLKNIEFPESLMSIESLAFASCPFSEVVIPKRVAKLESRVFSGCNMLTSVELPKGLESIQSEAFGGCSSLKDVYYKGNKSEWERVNIENNNVELANSNIHFADGSLQAPTLTPTPIPTTPPTPIPTQSPTTPPTSMPTVAPTEVPITEKGNCGVNCNWSLDANGMLHITGSGPMSYYYNKLQPWSAYKDEINILVVSEGVTSIGNSAFVNCSKLERIQWHKGLAYINDYAFKGCKSLVNIKLPEGLSGIGYAAFCYCTSLKSLETSKSLAEISKDTFFGCTALEIVDFSEGLVSIENRAFGNCTSLKRVVLPESLIDMGIDVFEGCSGLETVYLPRNLTVIDMRTFSGCTALYEVKLPEKLSYIGASAFADCSSLTSIEISKELSSVANNAFFKCDALEDVYYEGTKEQWDSIAIGDGNECLQNATIHYEVSMLTPTPSPTPTVPPVDTPEGNYTGIYWTEEDGKAVGYYYVEGKVKKGAGIVQIGDYLYYVLTSGKIAAGENKTVSASRTNDLIEAGTYYFYKNGVLDTQEVRLSGEIRWIEENGNQVGYYYVMDEIRKDVGLVELWNEEAGEPCWYYVLYSGKVKKNNVADGKRVNQTVKANKLNKYTGPAGTYSFYEDGVMYDPYATESGKVVTVDGVKYYYVDGHVRKDAGLIYVSREEYAGQYIFVTFSGKLKTGVQTVKETKCNGHTEYVGTHKFDSETGAMIIK